MVRGSAPLWATLGAWLIVAAIGTGAHAARPAPTSDRVLVIGDSVTARVYQVPAAAYQLEHRLEIEADTAVCRRLVQQSCAAEGTPPRTALELVARVRRAPRVVVVSVGANDSPTTFARDADALTRALVRKGTRHVVWVTLTESRPSFRAINDSIRRLPARWPGVVRVADWASASRGRDWFEQDRLHLSAAGALAHARLIRAAVVGACGERCVLPPRPPLQPLVPGKPVCAERAGGRWATILATAASAREALAVKQRAIAKGYTQSVIVQATPAVWEIVLFGYPNRKTALASYLDARERGFRASPVANVDTCGDESGTWKIVFGQARTDAEARSLLSRVRASGYVTAEIDDERPELRKVVLDNEISSTKQFELASAKALAAGFVVSYEPS